MYPFGISGNWRIDPDGRQNRGNSEPITRKMTPEEREKYSCKPPTEIIKQKSEILSVPGMIRKDSYMKKIDKSRLIEIVKEQGFTKDAYELASNEFGVTHHAIANYVSSNKLKDLVRTEPLPAKSIDSNQVSNNPPSDEMVMMSEIEAKVKTIVDENKLLKENMAKIKAALQEMLNYIA